MGFDIDEILRDLKKDDSKLVRLLRLLASVRAGRFDGTMREDALAVSLLREDQFLGLGVETVAPGASATLSYAMHEPGWLTQPVLDGDVPSAFWVTAVMVGGLPVSFGRDWTDRGRSLPEFLASEVPFASKKNGVWAFQGQIVSVHVQNMTEESHCVTGGALYDAFAPNALEILRRAAKQVL